MVDNIMPSGVAPYIPGGAFDRLTPSAVPGVYTDDISAYELVCKLIRYVNDFVVKVNSLGISNNALAVAYTNLSAYVHTVLDGLDVPAAVREAFDQFINDGMFEEGVMLIIDKYFEEHPDIGSGIFVVNLNTDNNDNFVASNTQNEIAHARASGKLVLLRYGAYITHVLAGESDDALYFEPLLHFVVGMPGYCVNNDNEWSSFVIDAPLTQDDVINALNSEETNKPLSAAQGAKLMRLIDGINASENELKIIVEGESDFSEVKNGVDSGKCVFCLLDGMYMMPMVDYNEPGRSAMFAMTTDKKVVVSTVINSTWHYKEYLISFTDVLNLMTSTVDDKSTDIQIPTAKAVYNISQQKLDSSKLAAAVNAALAQAKESGEFNGESGGYYSPAVEQSEDGRTLTFSFLPSDNSLPVLPPVGLEIGSYDSNDTGIFVGNADTTFEEYREAFTGGKACFMIRPYGGTGNTMWTAYTCNQSNAQFYRVIGNGDIQYGMLNSDGTFKYTTLGRTTTIDEKSTNDQIPTAKAVYEVINKSGQNVELDTTLTVAGKAADAKAVGDRISAISGGDTTGVFVGKTASFYGDSLTENNRHYTKGYHAWIKEILGLASYNNYGVSGYTVSSVYNKVNSVTDEANVVFVMCGVNDQNSSVPLGTLDDTTTGTTYGALNLLCALLKQKYPTSIIVFITPAYQTKYPHSAGITSYEVSKAIREVCEKYAIPVYDNFVLSGIYDTNLSVFTTDNCHWNDVAHEMVGKNLARFMVNTFRYIHGNTAGGDTHTHSWNDGVVTVEPTEDAEGVKTYTCTVCGETRTETVPALDHEHGYVSTVIAPTCTEQGYTEHICSCGDSYKDTYVDATGHNYVDGICSVCGAADPDYTATAPKIMEITGAKTSGSFHVSLYVTKEDLPEIQTTAEWGFNIEPLTEFAVTTKTQSAVFTVDTVNDLSAGFTQTSGPNPTMTVEESDGAYVVSLVRSSSATADRAYWCFPANLNLPIGAKFKLSDYYVRAAGVSYPVHAIGGAFAQETFTLTDAE